MNSRFLIAASAIALMLPVTSFAQEKSEGTVKSDLMDAKKAVSSAIDSTKSATKEAYKNIKAALITEDENPDFTYVTIDMNKTALGILNEPIFNTMNKKIGMIEDIILNERGQAQMIIISHGGFLGIGDKNAAFDYDLVMRRASDGDIVIPLSKTAIDTAKIFSYNRKEEDEKTRTIPIDGISLKDLMKVDLVDYNDDRISDVQNIFFQNGYAYQLIIGFDKTMGVGGQRVLMNFDSLKLINKDGKYQFQMSQKQSTQFERFKKSASK